MTPAFMSFGFSELLLVGVVALLVFGGNLPDVMRTLGRSYAKLRQSLHEFSRPVREGMRHVTALPPPTPPVARDQEPEVPDYPEEPETAVPPPAPSGPAIDEPPPV